MLSPEHDPTIPHTDSNREVLAIRYNKHKSPERWDFTFNLSKDVAIQLTRDMLEKLDPHYVDQQVLLKALERIEKELSQLMKR